MKGSITMEATNYRIDFAALCAKYKLGAVTGVPEPVGGGFLHRMYRVVTDRAEYAVKALNPQIMQRSEAMGNMIFAEKVATKALAQGINALPAMLDGDSCMYEAGGQYYLVFPWREGKSLPAGTVDLDSAAKIGTVLADIHTADFADLLAELPQETFIPPAVDWKAYAGRSMQLQIEYADKLAGGYTRLQQYGQLASAAAQGLQYERVISHRDLDPKNVLWTADRQPLLIDWESAGAVHPMQELVEVALYWSGFEAGNSSKEAFQQLIRAYRNNGGTLCSNWEDVLNLGYQGKLDWLEYSLKRALGDECADKAEQELGASQVIGTLELLDDYAAFIPLCLEWLAEV
ncbi:aminoglycoside phosphotransferase family protein [Paenibacillus sp. DMB5]|uniref:phosphotransferase enzyme family protein n=1 Tax=Paenibacillus sp. DMB5 TaxID=1780103 RepID=UPI0012FFC25A|nr:aminoglycoside phosphotransferase family protein [Paenibacillus sp. DMB5]